MFILLLLSLLLQFLTIGDLLPHIRLKELFWVSLAGLTGLPFGIELLLRLPAEQHRFFLGMLLVAYGSFMLARPAPRPLPQRYGLPGAVVAAALGGITGGLAAFPSASLVIWCSLQGWPKERQRALFQPFIIVMQVAGIALLAWRSDERGLPGGAGVLLEAEVLELIAPTLLGGLLGLKVFRQLSDRGFERLVFLLLLISGLALAF